MSTRALRQQAGVTLFPFIAVLICTMGALIVLLVLLVQHTRAEASAVAATQAGGPPDDAQTELRQRLDEAQWQRELLEKSRAEKAEELAAARARVAHLEEHIQRLEAQAKELLERARAIDEGKKLRSGDLAAAREEARRLKDEIEKKKKELEEARKKAADGQEWYALVPYDGRSGTRRRPIYVECTEFGVIIQPEGILLKAEDFAALGPGNPLDSALRAVREHYERTAGNKAGQAYPLLVVRPSGVYAFDAARSAIRAWDDEWGYELISDDKHLDFGPPDPALNEVLAKTVNVARQRQAAMIAMMPRTFQRQEQITSFAPEPSNRAGGDSRYVGNGTGPGIGGAGASGPQPRSASDGPGGVSGSGNSPTAGNGNGTGTGTNGYGNFTPTGGATDGSGNGGRYGNRAGNGALSGSGSGAGPGGPSWGNGNGGNGSGGSGASGVAGSGANGNSAVGGYGNGAIGYGNGSGGYANGSGSGFAGGGASGATGAGSSGVGSSGNSASGVGAPGTGGAGAFPGSPLNGSGGSDGSSGGYGSGGGMAGTQPGSANNGSVGGSGSGAIGSGQGGIGGQPGGSAGSSTGSFAGANGGSSAAGGASSTGGDSSSGGGSSSSSGGSSSSAGGSPLGGSSAMSGNPGGMGMPSLNFGQSQPQFADSSNGSKSSGSPKSTAKRGANWALPAAKVHHTGVTRPIQVNLEPDRVVMLPERGDNRGPQVVKVAPELSSDDVDHVVAAVQNEVKGWGLAVADGYWKPVLQTHVAVGAERHFQNLETALKGSGIEIVRK